MPDDRADVLHNSRRQFSTFWSAPSVSLARFAPAASPWRPNPSACRGVACPGIIRGGRAGAPLGCQRVYCACSSSARGDAGGVSCEILGGRPGPRFVATRPRRVFRGARLSLFWSFPPSRRVSCSGTLRPSATALLRLARGSRRGSRGPRGRRDGRGRGRGRRGSGPPPHSFIKSAGEVGHLRSSALPPIAPSAQLPLPLPLALVGPAPPGVGCLPPSKTCAARPLTVVSPGCCGLR